MFGFFTLSLAMFTSFVGAATHESKLDTPIIGTSFLTHFDQKRPVRVDISVCDANGNGEKALDFFLVEEADTSIPNTLREIISKSSFIANMIKTFFEQGSKTLMITEMLSRPDSKEKINNFIGLNQSDYGDK